MSDGFPADDDVAEDGLPAPLYVGKETPYGDTYDLVGGERVYNVHSPMECDGHCVIHEPSLHHMRTWKQSMIGGQVVRRCEHGEWHIDPDSLGPEHCTCICRCCFPPSLQNLTKEQMREQLEEELRALRSEL